MKTASPADLAERMEPWHRAEAGQHLRRPGAQGAEAGGHTLDGEFNFDEIPVSLRDQVRDDLPSLSRPSNFARHGLKRYCSCSASAPCWTSTSAFL